MSAPEYKDKFNDMRELLAGFSPKSKDDLLAFQQLAATLVKTATAVEKDLRKQVVGEFSHDAKPGHFGTENVDIGWGYKLKVVHGIDYKLDTANDCEKLDKVLDQIEKSMEGGNIIAQRLVKWKPELSVTEYKQLSPANKKLIDTVITVTDKLPTVELVPPKTA